MSHKLLAIIFIGLIVLSNFACTDEDNSTDRLSIESFAILPLETVFEFTESDDLAFRFIRSMKADRHGNILVDDPSHPAVFMFEEI